jgi:DNA repair protein RadC
MPSPETDNSGHRARLRKRLAEHGGDGLLDHELIEYLLALAIPRRDTKPIANALLTEFGGIAGLLTAEGDAIARVPGMGETSVAAIKIVHAAALRLLSTQVTARPVLANWQALLDYLRADMAHHPIERVRVLHLNTRNMLIRDELMSEGSVDEAALYVREVIRRAIELGSSAIILVHIRAETPRQAGPISTSLAMSLRRGSGWGSWCMTTSSSARMGTPA